VDDDLVVAGDQASCVIDARRQLFRRGIGRDASWLRAAFHGGAPTKALDIHFDDDGVMHEAIDGGHGHGWIWEDRIPGAKWLIGGDQERPSLVARRDKFEEHAGLCLALLDVGNVIEDEQVIFVEPLD